MATPNLPVKATAPWKRVAIISFFSGLGFALGTALVFGSFVWYKSRPKAWDSHAIKASFDRLGTLDETKSLTFFYVLENTSKSDFLLESNSNINLTGRLQKEGALSEDFAYVTVQKYPVFIPSKKKGLVALTVPFPFVDECQQEIEKKVASKVGETGRPSALQNGVETIESLASRVKAKYKTCESVSNEHLVQKVVSLYPVYLESLKPGEREKIPSDDDSPGQKQLKEYVTKHMPNLDGFILLDGATRYEIDFPKGW